MKMCERVMANLQMIGAIKKGYMSHEAFDVHPTTKHKEPDPFPDQLKGMWFCLKENIVSCVDGRTTAKFFPIDGSEFKNVSIPKKCSDIYHKGCKKVAEQFTRKMHECFPGVRTE